MARKGCREFHLREDEILELLMADNSDAEDELLLDEEDQDFLENDVDEAADVVEIESAGQEPDEIIQVDNSVASQEEQELVFKWSNGTYTPHTYCESSYQFDFVNIFSDNQDMVTPMEIFSEVAELNRLLLDIVIPESIRYAEQNGRSFNIEEEEMKAFLGMNFVMSYKVLPNLRSYWSTDEDMGVPYIANIMTRTRFEQIRQNLHFYNNDSNASSTDRAYKIRPVFDHFNSCFQNALNNSKRQSIDEHMIKFKGHNVMKQYIKNKPIKWGFKMWCRCDSSTGYLFEFDLYTGRKTNAEVGLGESVVLNLTQKLNGLGCEIYFDNFFNSPRLQYKLMMKNLKACGTVRTNRKNIPKNLPLDKTMQRGDIYYASFQGISLIKWMDTKSVHMLTNFISPEETTFVKRRQAKSAQKISVVCPEVITNYNKYMGGVDLMDQRKVCYEVDRKAKIKYYLRLFFDIMDIAVNNAYVVYTKLHNNKRVEGSLLNSLEYRQVVARNLINSYTSRQRARPTQKEGAKSKTNMKHILPAHNMQKVEKMKRCVNCAKNRTENRTHNICVMCNVHLCFTSKRNCFAEYHN